MSNKKAQLEKLRKELGTCPRCEYEHVGVVSKGKRFEARCAWCEHELEAESAAELAYGWNLDRAAYAETAMKEAAARAEALAEYEASPQRNAPDIYAMVEAATTYVESHTGDTRDCIKEGALNAFYAGVMWAVLARCAAASGVGE